MSLPNARDTLIYTHIWEGMLKKQTFKGFTEIVIWRGVGRSMMT